MAATGPPRASVPCATGWRAGPRSPAGGWDSSGSAWAAASRSTIAARGGFGATAPNYGRVPKGAEELRGICPVVASFGAEDRMLRTDPERLSAHLRALGVDHDVKVYPGVGHSFMNDHRRGVAGRLMRGYDEAAAEDAWRRILAFFERHLR